VSPTPPEAQAIESRKVQTLLKIRIEAPMSNISIQMIVFISYFGLSIRLRGHPASFFGFFAGPSHLRPLSPPEGSPATWP